MIQVEVIFAVDAQNIWQKQIQLPKGATLDQALVQSGFYAAHDKQGQTAPCGVFGVQRDKEHRLQNGDQVEVYRPLVFDPMESRRRRAAHRARQKTAQRKRKNR